MSARQLLDTEVADEIIVRIDVEPNPAEPSDEDRVRDFEMSDSGWTDWRSERETKALLHHLKLF